MRRRSDWECGWDGMWWWFVIIWIILVAAIAIPLSLADTDDDTVVVTSPTPAASAVGTAQLEDGAVTVAKLAPGALQRPHHWECTNASDVVQAAVDWAQNGANWYTKGVLMHNALTRHPNCRACDGTLMLYGDAALWASAPCVPMTHSQILAYCNSIHSISNIAHPHSYLPNNALVGINCTAPTAARRLLSTSSHDIIQYEAL